MLVGCQSSMSDSGEPSAGWPIIVAIRFVGGVNSKVEQANFQAMMLTPTQCEQARRSRDVRFDGRFITGVVTTGIYCRPVCPAPPAAAANVRYFASPAAAQDAGFRPCLRCRPELAPRTPEWMLANAPLTRALRLVDSGYLDEHSVADLATEIGLSERHVGRLFAQHLGASPLSLARTRRVQLAKRLLNDTQLPMTAIAMHAGFGSLRSFNNQMRRAYQRSPSELRKQKAGRSLAAASQLPLRLRLPLRQPYNVDWVFDFLRKRALAGVELVEGQCYRRRLNAQGDWLQVAWQQDALVLELPEVAQYPVSQVLPVVRRLFDLDADSQVIDEHLARQANLSNFMGDTRGLRVPGAWDGFETAVRALLGQQVSVARATVLAAAMVERYGAGEFPSPEQLAAAEVAELGMPGQRGRAISELAKRVALGDIQLDDTRSSAELTESMCNIRGIGPWTASYVGLRVARDPDAFPQSDWVVLKMLGATPVQVRKQSQSWRPWRSYALMYLWHAANAQPKK